MSGSQSRDELVTRLIGAGWDPDDAREAAAIEHGGHGCEAPGSGGESEQAAKEPVDPKGHR